jgi:hypothetical protein
MQPVKIIDQNDHHEDKNVSGFTVYNLNYQPKSDVHNI